VYQIYQNRPSFVEDITKTFWSVFFWKHYTRCAKKACWERWAVV